MADLTSEQLLEAYSNGFQGWVRIPEHEEQFLASLANPYFTQAAPNLYGSGKGKLSLPFKSVIEFDPEAYTERQLTGDCVSHSTRNAADVSRAIQIINGAPEGWLARGCTEAIYGARGHGGQGMSCSTASEFISKKGGLLVRARYGDIDLSKYTGDRGWGGRGVPNELVEEARKHQVGTVTLVTTIEEARDAIANGYGVSVCSDQGFSSIRDENGIAKPQGSWSHAMAWVACDDTGGETLFLVQNCFSDDTEILTENGWKLFSDLSESEKVATFNPDGNFLEYHLPTEYHKYHYNGKMIHFTGRFTDCMVTPNHNMYVTNSYAKQKNKPYKFITAENVKESHIHRRYFDNWKGQEQETIDVCGYSIKMDDWLEFLGYFLSEGWANVRVRENRKRANGNIILMEKDGYVGISQDEGEILSHMEDIISRLPWKFSKKELWEKERRADDRLKHYQLMCYDTEFAQYMSQFGGAGEKFIPEYVFSLSREQQRLLFKTMMNGDGRISSFNYGTSSVKLRDTFQRLCIHLGFGTSYGKEHSAGDIVSGFKANYDFWRVSIYAKPGKSGNGQTGMLKNKEIIDYSGYVYCVTVKNHTIMIRRNGKTLITGQSWGNWNSGPKKHGQPDGSFWIRSDVAARMLSGRGSYAYSMINGFPPQALPDYGTGSFF